MKAKGIYCDICGDNVRRRGATQYVIKKRLWLDTCFKKIDLCEKCYSNLEKTVKAMNDASEDAINPLDLLDFLFNKIDPNLMERYIRMYQSEGVSAEGSAQND